MKNWLKEYIVPVMIPFIFIGSIIFLFVPKYYNLIGVVIIFIAIFTGVFLPLTGNNLEVT